jgi:hypothetical protein
MTSSYCSSSFPNARVCHKDIFLQERGNLAQHNCPAQAGANLRTLPRTRRDSNTTVSRDDPFPAYNLRASVDSPEKVSVPATTYSYNVKGARAPTDSIAAVRAPLRWGAPITAFLMTLNILNNAPLTKEQKEPE